MSTQPGASFEWGASGARALAPSCATLVVVDVLSFTTTVCVAAGFGTEVLPCADERAARQLADATGAELAVSRHEADERRPWSLSPASLLTAPRVARLVVASPNGGAISAAGAGPGKPVIAACLRNVTAVVTWLLGHGFGEASRPVAVVAAGERWSDGSLRPAIEDLFGAGLVLAGLAEGGVSISAEATVAAHSVAGLSPLQLADLVRASTSGVELKVAGYGDDVEMAVEGDADAVVPMMAEPLTGFRDEVVRGERR
ncbi:MAG: 2-phosphosulfolactate phosphatase [Acidimicrobiales bacterium]